MGGAQTWRSGWRVRCLHDGFIINRPQRVPIAFWMGIRDGGSAAITELTASA
jgi:hypothetical protein